VTTRPILRKTAVFGMAWLGLLLGHALDYVIAVPNHFQRHALLHATGHGYLPIGFIFAIPAALLSTLAAIHLGWRDQRRRETAITFAPTWARLSLVQTAAFVILELVERLAVGAPLEGIAPLLLLGGVAQVVVAAAGAALLIVMKAAGELVARLLTRPRRAFVLFGASAASRPIIASNFSFSAWIRGPPTARVSA
jgi:hypothetical protein